ncbi:MARVEL domain-containing protein 3 isoform X2 [Pseudophryne corroboree]|uniref:MARVEL domain-containing protein 3 isoform X2 n=1 Tax=Pseudophryne corroboree TaxID=495146 RepID=UPI003081D0B4
MVQPANHLTSPCSLRVPGTFPAAGQRALFLAFPGTSSSIPQQVCRERRVRALRCVVGVGCALPGLTMVDSGPYPSDGENRAPRKPRYEKRSGHSGTRDSNPETQNGYSNEKSESRHQHERSRSRHQDREDRREERPHSRHHEDRSHSRHQERDQQYEGKEQSRNQREKRRDGYKERDRYHEDRRQSERSRSHHEERDSYSTEKSHYHERDDYHKERSRSGFDEKERRQEHYVHSVERQGHPGKDPEHYYPSERTFAPNDAQMNDMEYYEPESEGGILNCHKCKYLCTGRGVLQMLEVILNALVLICIISSYFVLSGFSGGMASGGFGGGYYPFEGQELQEVRQLDQQFTLLRSPLIYGGLTVSLLMGTTTLAMLAAGSKHLLSLSDRWLLFEAAFSSVASLGYGVAVGVFLHFAIQINSTDVCKRRERLYARNGLTWMNCDLAGTDGGAATFAILVIILYVASVVLAARAYRERRDLQQ